MSRSSEYRKTRKLLEKKKKEKFDKFKCTGCVWGTWTGKSYKCSLPRCLKKLGTFKE